MSPGAFQSVPQPARRRFLLRRRLCRDDDRAGDRARLYPRCAVVRRSGANGVSSYLSLKRAGIATLNALKKSGAEAGDNVAILGIGGLGHMALQYARRMGFRVVAVGRGEDIAADATKLGAHCYIDTDKESAADVLNAIGGAKAILTTIANPAAVSALMPALAPEGRLIVLGVGKDPLPVSTGYLVGAERGIVGSITGSPFENEKALDFSVLTGVRPMIETMPLERAAEAVQKMRCGDAKFRIVLTMGDQSNAHQ